MNAILDTSVVLAAGVPELAGDLSVSAVTVAELQFGVLAAVDEAVRAERLRRLSVLQRCFDPIPVDDTVTRSYGLLASALARAGHPPRATMADLLIAATAHAHGARLYTRNPAALKGLEALLDIAEVPGGAGG